jgi:hypothetical protein
MRSDAQLAFVAIGSPLSLVGASGIAIASGIIDLLGQGVGTAPQNIIGTQSATFGAPDAMGVGGTRPELNVIVGTALAGTAGNTLNVALQGAADQGSAGNYQPSTWNNIINQDGITLAEAAANTVIFRTPWLPPMPANLRPRYLRLLFSPATSSGAIPSGDFTAGTILSAIVTLVRDDQFNKYAQKNFTVA